MKIVKRDGHIVDYDPEKIRIAIGKANTEVRGKEKASKEDKIRSVKREFKPIALSPEINVIGQNVEEACFAIDKYLDNCYLAKLGTCRIVHGKGTGKLRQGIHSFLKTHPHVKGFRLGTFGEGEMGVTVVELK